jgi:tRNA (cmo5U34)-methyltransferase
MSTVGDNITASNADWKFSGQMVDTFDDHVSKSVPLYKEGHNLICQLSDYFVKKDSVVYELGCSTGTLTFQLYHHNRLKEGAQYYGFDIEADMIAKANQKLTSFEHIPGKIQFTDADITRIDFEPADLFVCYYTIQFVHPKERQQLINRIYESLNWGGALILFEKVRFPDARFQDIITTLYNDYKLMQGYSCEEIVTKTRSLKGILEPFSSNANIDMLKRAGFQDICTVQKYLAFEGFLAIK